MPTSFIAKQVFVEEEHGILVVALSAPSTAEEDFYLILQHKNEYDEQDLRLGMNEPYVEFCGQDWSWYGHVDSFVLMRDRINIRMNSVAADRMKNDGDIQVQFAIDDHSFSDLGSALRIVFRGQSYFTEAV